MSVGAQGLLAGNGLVQADVTNAGVVEPTGVLTIDGDYHQAADAAMVLTLDGHARTLQSSGVVTLGGTLAVQLAEGASPRAGDRFRLVAADAVLGTFDQLDLPTLPGGLRLDVTYGPDAVTLNVVVPALSPEAPGTNRGTAR